MAAPERFAKRSDSFPLHRGRRPYMALDGSARASRLRPHLNELRTHRTVARLGAPNWSFPALGGCFAILFAA
jgi:hypothetical protein